MALVFIEVFRESLLGIYFIFAGSTAQERKRRSFVFTCLECACINENEERDKQSVTCDSI